jgi:hypothetical protein
MAEEERQPRQQRSRSRSKASTKDVPTLNRRKAKIEYKKDEKEVLDTNPIEVPPNSGKKRGRPRGPRSLTNNAPSQRQSK